MPKTNKKKKNSKNKNKNVSKRELQFKDASQEYVLMTKMLGDRRIMVTLPDRREILAIIPGRFRKRVWMKPGDILLASYRDFQNSKLDIVHKYTSEEIRNLRIYNEIPQFFVDSISGKPVNEKDDGIVFQFQETDDFDFDNI